MESSIKEIILKIGKIWYTKYSLKKYIEIIIIV